MKTRYISILTIGAMALAAASCSDVVNYDDGVEDIFAADGAPVIEAIYDVEDTESTAPLSGGSLDQMLRIHGRNLSHVKSVTFNGIEVPVSQIYATSADAWLKVPRAIPEATDNKLVYTTELGTLTRDFEVSIPSMRLEGLGNEFCQAGESVQVLGDYFDLFGYGVEGSGASVSIAGTPLEIDSITEEYMSIVIPEGTPDNTLIDFAWEEPDGPKTKTVAFRYTRGILLEDLSSVGWWDSSVHNYITAGNNSGDPRPTLGSYFRFNGNFDQWTWYQFGGGANWPESMDCRGRESEYVFKFEVYSAAKTPFYDSQDWGYQFALNDSDPLYVWNPSAGMSFNTYGRWRTVTIPLDQVARKGTVEPGTWSNFQMVMQPNTEGGWSVDHCFANFRIEPANF